MIWLGLIVERAFGGPNLRYLAYFKNERALDAEAAVQHVGSSGEAVAVTGVEGSREEAAAIKEGGLSPAQSSISSDFRPTDAAAVAWVLYHIDCMGPGTHMTFGM